MLTLFSTPKPFRGQFADLQNNALDSWRALAPLCDVVLLGDAAGTSDAAARIGAAHIGRVRTNAHGTPLVSSLFEQAKAASANELLCYVNADIILTRSFLAAVKRIARARKRFLMVGRRWNLEVSGRLDFASGWEAEIIERAVRAGELGSPHAIDFFVFPRGMYAVIPDFAIGRFSWDNWLIHSALAHRASVVDATSVAFVIHQNHDYSHVAANKQALWDGAEAVENRRLAGGWQNLLTLEDATHVMTRYRIRPNLTPRRFKKLLTRNVHRVAPGALRISKRLLRKVPSGE